jgi:hypothetical protein
MEKSSALNYYKSRFFTAKMPVATAKKLAEEAVTQMAEQGFYGISFELLYKSMLGLHIHPDSKRMQYALPKGEKYEQEIRTADHEDMLWFPRRIVRNNDTHYVPTKIELIAKEIQENLFNNITKGYNSSHVCRNARKKLQPIFYRAFSRGYKFSLMGTFVIDNRDTEGLAPHDENNGVLRHTRRPWFIVPGATTEEKQTITDYCAQFQIPSQTLLDKLSGKTD